MIERKLGIRTPDSNTLKASILDAVGSPFVMSRLGFSRHLFTPKSTSSVQSLFERRLLTE
jgi:hypothetical protein